MREIRVTWSSIFPLQASNDNRSVLAQQRYKPWLFAWIYRCEPHRKANDNPRP